MTPPVPAFGPERCAQFLAGTAGSPPREQLMRALALTHPHDGSPRRALDLGCGEGREVVELLRAGYEVVAIDPYPEMLERTRARVASEGLSSAPCALTLVQATIEEFAPRIDRGSFQLIHAGFVLPFVVRDAFAAAFARVREGVAPRGFFVGQFFGPDDEFIREAATGTMTSHSAVEVRDLFSQFDLVLHEEVNRSGHIGKGRSKWWHVHHVIAQRRELNA